MLEPYRRILAVPGARAFASAGFFAQLPVSMLTLGVVILVQRTTGSYARAGSIAATVGVMMVLAAPILARWADVLGQRTMLRPTVVVQSGAIVLLVSASVNGAPSWVLYASAALLGAAAPSVGSMVRARWSHVLDDPTMLHTAYSFEAVLDELIFVVGPLVVTVLATFVHPMAGPLLAAAFVLAGGLALAAQTSTEPPMSPRTSAQRSALHVRGVAVVALMLIGAGGVFGATEVVVVAFTSQRHHPGAAGLVLALWALGSLVAGLAYGSVHWKSTLRQRFLWTSLTFAAATPFLLLAPSIPLLAVLMLFAGASISPSIISAFALVESLLPPERLTEGLTWATASMTLGYAAGAAFAGHSIDLFGARPSFWVAVGSGVFALVAVVGGYRIVRPRSVERAS